MMKLMNTLHPERSEGSSPKQQDPSLTLRMTTRNPTNVSQYLHRGTLAVCQKDRPLITLVGAIHELPLRCGIHLQVGEEFPYLTQSQHCFDYFFSFVSLFVPYVFMS